MSYIGLQPSSSPRSNDLLEAIRANAPSVEIVSGPAAKGKLLLATFRVAQRGLELPQPITSAEPAGSPGLSPTASH
jgi:hypothetical protein